MSENVWAGYQKMFGLMNILFSQNSLWKEKGCDLPVVVEGWRFGRVTGGIEEQLEYGRYCAQGLICNDDAVPTFKKTKTFV